MHKGVYEDHDKLTRKLFPFIFHEFTLEKYSVFSAHWHKNIELLYCIDGVGSVTVAGQSCQWSAGDLIAINPNEIHTLQTDSKIEYYCLIVTYDFCVENGIDVSEKVLMHCINNERINSLFDTVCNNFSASKPDITKTRIDVLSLLYELYKNHSHINEKNDKNFNEIANVIQYIYNNYDKNITLDDAAAVAGLSKFYFMKKFKQVTGTTFVLFLNTIRCNNAAQMIADGVPISDAGYACGFNDPAFFSRTFKKLLGKNPSSVKKQTRN